MINICPVCKQSGLPDYRKEITICPQCNSDLRPYMLINLLSNKKSKVGYIIPIVLITCLTFLSVFLLTSNNNYKDELVENYSAIKNLNDSIQNLKNQNKNLINSPEVNNESKILTISYKLKKGDNLWKIAKFFYGDGRKYKLIEKDNSLSNPYVLEVGHQLIIKIY